MRHIGLVFGLEKLLAKSFCTSAQNLASKASYACCFLLLVLFLLLSLLLLVSLLDVSCSSWGLPGGGSTMIGSFAKIEASRCVLINILCFHLREMKTIVIF